MADARVITIDGRAALVVERARPIPESLVLMINGGRDRRGRVWRPLRIAASRPLRLGGATADCLREDHRLVGWLEGFHSGSDDVARYLVLNVCADCGAVCVRDRSFDSLDGLRAGRRPLRRRDEIIGWYSGGRPNGRVYA